MLNDNKLKKVKDEYTILSLLFGAKDSNADIFIWKLIGNSKHLGQIRIESIRKMRNDFCITPAEGQDRAVQEILGTGHSVDIYIPDSATLLRCTIKQADAPYRYYLHFPEHAAQVERRESFRLHVYDQEEVKLNFKKNVISPRSMSQHFHKDCYDLSPGGFSFLVSKVEGKFFQLGDIIEDIEIKAGKWSSKVVGQIVTVREVEPDAHNGLTYKVWRISCRFEKIDQISRKYIEKFIFERIKDELRVINE